MPEQIENSMVVDRDYHTRKVICMCDQCGGNIYEQDDHYIFGNETVCEGCIDGYIADHRGYGYG